MTNYINAKTLTEDEIKTALKGAYDEAKKKPDVCSTVVEFSEEGNNWEKSAREVGFRFYTTKFEGWQGTDALLYIEEPLGLGCVYFNI